MSQIDLKRCTIKIKDGFAKTGQINNPSITNPVTTPTVAPTGGGSGGGSLAAGDYYVWYTFVNAVGQETAKSTESLQFTVSSGNIPRVTLPALITNAVSIKLYATLANGASASETLYASGITSTTYDMSAAHPNAGGTVPTTNQTGTHPVGAGTIKVDNYSGSVTNGDTFKITGDTTTYTVTSHSESGGNTISITFTPILVSGAADNTLFTMQPHELTVKVGEGTLSYTEKVNRIYVKDRGKLGTVRNGDEEPVEIKLDFIWEFLKADSGQTPSVEDVLKQRGEASHWVTSSSDTCEPYAVNMEITYDPYCTDQDDEVTILQDFRYEQLDHDFKQGMVAVTGKCNVIEASITR